MSRASRHAYAQDLEIAMKLADCADGITMRYFMNDPGVTVKPDRSLVTIADVEAERRMAEIIDGYSATDTILAEELHSGSVVSGRVWAIDPIDHTNNYARGLPIFATLISLLVDGRPVVGVVSAPAIGERWWAAKGEGAFSNGRSIEVSRVSDIRDSHISFAQLEAWQEMGLLQALTGLVGKARWSFGSGGFLAQMWVAEGKLDVSLDSTGYVWDLAASQIIVEEAGGTFTDVHGMSTPSAGTAIASNGYMHEEVLRALCLS
ncbi:inositol monophosphatase family protein [Microbispora rosea]|uniref:inositol monophosphatase family protein n=1 Tax=Microbispora rosea TaxID=58117 RepID=UPI003D8FEB4C